MQRLTALFLGFILFGFSPVVVLAQEVEAEIKVSKINCGSCLMRINNTVQQLDGASASTRYDNSTNRLWFPYDSEKISAQNIAESITEIGYPAEVINDGLE